MTAAFIIRFHYEESDPRFKWRFEYFVNEVLPRIINQTYKDFDICIWINEWQQPYFDKLKEIAPRLKTFTVKDYEVQYKEERGRKYYYDFTPWKNVEGLEPYDLQMGLDSDDLIDKRYVSAIVQQIKYPQLSLHICFQPDLFILKTGEKKPMKIRYNSNVGSAFMALYQPYKHNYHFIYEKSHLSLGRLARRSRVLPRGYCWATVHDINESTGK